MPKHIPYALIMYSKAPIRFTRWIPAAETGKSIFGSAHPLFWRVFCARRIPPNNNPKEIGENCPHILNTIPISVNHHNCVLMRHRVYMRQAQVIVTLDGTVQRALLGLLLIRTGAMPRFSSATKSFAALMGFYCLGLFSLISALPFWLDEVLEIRTIGSSPLSQLPHRVAENAGGVPVDYYIRFLFTQALGLSRFSARLPSLLSSLAAALGVFVLAKKSAFRFPLVAVSIFCLLPLQVRYALEARPYEAALAFSVWATVAFRELVFAPAARKAIGWGVLCCLCLYTQPFAFYLCVAHLVWFVLCFRVRANTRLYLYACLPFLAAVLAFLPWQVWQMKIWATQGQQHYSVGAKAIPLILHELTGAGYLGTGVLVTLAVCAAVAHPKATREVCFWALAVVVPMGLTLAADSAFHYFLAIRQVVFVLPPLALLSAYGLERLDIANRRAVPAVCSALVVIFLYANATKILGPHEDWEGPARKLAQLSSKTPASTPLCIIFLPEESAENYSVFAPVLRGRGCAAFPSGPVAVVTRLPGAGEQTCRTLSRNGYSPREVFEFAGGG